MLPRLTNALEALFVLLLGTIVIYWLRHYLVLGCCVGMALCLIGIWIIGKIEGNRKRKAASSVPLHSISLPEGSSLAAAVGSRDSSFIVNVVKGVTGPIGDAVKMSLGSGQSEVAGTAKGTVSNPHDPTGLSEKEPG
jgi:hypothetical protein